LCNSALHAEVILATGDLRQVPDSTSTVAIPLLQSSVHAHTRNIHTHTHSKHTHTHAHSEHIHTHTLETYTHTHTLRTYTHTHTLKACTHRVLAVIDYGPANKWECCVLCGRLLFNLFWNL